MSDNRGDIEQILATHSLHNQFMKSIWVKKAADLTMPSRPSYRYATKVRFKFGEKAYANRNGFAQHRPDSKMPSETYLGRVLSTKGGTETMSGLIQAEFKLLKMIHDAIIKGEEI